MLYLLRSLIKDIIIGILFIYLYLHNDVLNNPFM